MCFSLLQFPRFRVNSIGNSLWESVYKSSSYGVICSKNHEHEGVQNRRWTRRTINTKGVGHNENLISNTSIRHEIVPETTKAQRSRKVGIRNKIVSESTGIKVNTYNNKVEKTIEVETDEYYADLAKLATIICFDIETTGFGRERDRIIEFACQDLRGGENSTFQSLVNPERDVPNEQIHGISSRMVNRYDVPRMKEFVPILLQYVRSRQLPGGVVVLVSHNGRTFDVPFLKNEFSRCSYEIPEDWLFADTLPLARSVMKSKGSKVTPRISLQALREHYGIPLIGPAHRALSDVHSLALILQRLTYDLKLPISGLIQGSFK
ncbi:exonuclease dpd1 chloroplastic/mitochondrial [Phtheirospermum japonicum]|uniref:Exonuclease dpd1 chloroplastic/mitochondrial n=1 Tax=Phtheirospermum japonicum TaxID=374723 RepID=A0A830B751_9LAMI|nr:exonuclease dpd1 chloroplastic/mitochondrial [Phtheirospermum japonicum]